MLAALDDAGAYDVEGDDQVLALGARLVDLAHRDVPVEGEADDRRRAAAPRLLVCARECLLARRVEARGVIGQLLVGLRKTLQQAGQPLRPGTGSDVQDRGGGDDTDRVVAGAKQQHIVRQREIGQHGSAPGGRLAVEHDGGPVDGDLNLAAEELMAVVGKRDVDDRVAARELRLLGEAPERERPSAVPGLGERLQFEAQAVRLPPAAPRIVLPSHLVDGAAHHLADGPHARLATEREVRDRQTGGEGARAVGQPAHAALGGQRDRPGLDACDILRTEAIGLAVVAVLPAAERVEQSHSPRVSRPTSRALRKRVGQIAPQAAVSQLLHRVRAGWATRLGP